MSQPTKPSPEVIAATTGDAMTDWRAAWGVHQPWLRTVVWARLGEGQAVDEVLQEVALAAAKGLTTLADPSKVGPWLYRVAIRQVLIHRRSAGRRRRKEDGFAMETASAGRQASYEPLDWLLAKEQRGVVRAALRRLTRRDAEILMLKYTENWTYRQLAEHLGISTSAVEARLHRARGRMRAALAALDPTLQETMTSCPT